MHLGLLMLYDGDGHGESRYRPEVNVLRQVS